MNKQVYPDVEIPANYSFLSEFPACFLPPPLPLKPIFSVLRALSHRFCRLLERPISLSNQFLVACDPTFIDGFPRSLFAFLEQSGVTDQDCHPWQEITRYSAGFCRQCASGDIPALYRTKFGSLRQLATVERLQQELYVFGPVVGAIGGEWAEIIGWEYDPDGLKWIIIDEKTGTGNETVRFKATGDAQIVKGVVYAVDPDVE
jgi:hypothetical protein